MALKIGLTQPNGKLGGAVLKALLEYHLVPASQLIVCTSSNPNDPKFEELKAQGLTVRYANYEDVASMESAFAGVDKLFLVSTPAIELDFDEAPPGQGREKRHIAAIEAAVRAGVRYIYYTSLGFADNSKAAVMWAHNRTERYLEDKFPSRAGGSDSSSDVRWTVLREGLYNESWPLYLGYYRPEGDERREVVIAGDGQISWTAIEDLGLATAEILAADEAETQAVHAGRKVVLSARKTHSLQAVAQMVSAAKNEEIHARVLGRDEYEQHHVGAGRATAAAVRWWSSTYDALEAGECDKQDGALEALLARHGRAPKPMEQTVREMVE